MRVISRRTTEVLVVVLRGLSVVLSVPLLWAAGLFVLQALGVGYQDSAPWFYLALAGVYGSLGAALIYAGWRAAAAVQRR